MVEVIVLIFLMPLLSLVSSKPVSLYISYPDNENYMFNVYFYNDTFKQFYDCMTQDVMYDCILTAAYEVNDRYVTNVLKDNSTINKSNMVYYSCVYTSSSGERVICTRLQQLLCNGTCKSFRLLDSSCQTPCVTIRFSLPNETLVYDSSTDKIDNCTSTCTTVETSTTSHIGTTQSHSDTTIGSTETRSDTTIGPTDIHNNTIGREDTNSDKNNTGAIAGAVCGVLLLLILLLIVGVVLWRRRRLNAEKHRKRPHREINSAFPSGNLSGKPHQQESRKIGFSYLNTIEALATIDNSNIDNIHDEDSNNGYYILESSTGSKYENTSDRYHEEVNNNTNTTQQNKHLPDYTGVSEKKKSGKDNFGFDNSDGYSTAEEISIISDDISVKDTGGYSTAEEISNNSSDNMSVQESGGYSTAHDIDSSIHNSRLGEIDDYSKAGALEDSCSNLANVKQNTNYSMAGDFTNSDVDYSLAKDVNTLEAGDTTSEPNDGYSRLGEQVVVIKNPYDSLV